MLQKVDVASTFCSMKVYCAQKAVIRATNSLNLERNIVARQVERKCCSYYWGLKQEIQAIPQMLNLAYKLKFICVASL